MGKGQTFLLNIPPEVFLAILFVFIVISIIIASSPDMLKGMSTFFNSISDSILQRGG